MLNKIINILNVLIIFIILIVGGFKADFNNWKFEFKVIFLEIIVKNINILNLIFPFFRITQTAQILSIVVIQLRQARRFPKNR